CSGCYAKIRPGEAKKHLPEDLHNPEVKPEIRTQKKQWSDLQQMMMLRQVPEDVVVDVSAKLLPYFREAIPILAKECRQVDMLRPVLRRIIEQEGIAVDVDVVDGD